LSYYTIFALPPLLILLIKFAGMIWAPGSAEAAIESQFAGPIGAESGRIVRAMVASGEQANQSALSTIVGLGGLLVGATGAFLSLQSALNAVWQVQPDPKLGGVKRFVAKRLLSLGMVAALAFLLVASLAVTAALSALATAVGTASVVMQIVNSVVSIGILAVLFAGMFRFLPDAIIGWRSVWIGGVATAVMLELGKFVIGLYLGHSRPGTPFGGASALAVILVWIYYAGMLVLLGAEFTENFANARGHGVRPKPGAVWVERENRVESPNHPEPAKADSVD
jgi:membrane protein